jgi:TRAP transporter TAXI family solute receptor
VGNPRLVAKNETPLGLSFTVTNRWALDGKEAYTEKLENLRGLVGGFDTYYLVAMATKKLGITSVREIRDKKLPVRVYTQPVGALGEFAGRQLLRAAGLGYNEIRGFGGSTQHVGYNVIIDAFKDGRADILFAVVTPKHPSVSEIVSSVDVEFLGLDADTTKALLPLGYTAATMPPETFKGQSKPVSTVGFPTVLITNKDLPEPIAYTVTRTVLENKDALVRGHGGLAEFDPQTAWRPEKVGIPLHPGAERAYREKGWMK